jgi:uncharacterized membrane protein YfcA
VLLLGVVCAIGLIGGGLSGLLGIGGGIVTAPLLLYLPPLFGAPPLGMHLVSGLTITQAFFAGLFGMLGQRGAGTIDRRLALVMGGSIALASLAGGAASKLVPAQTLLGLFVVLALGAAVLLVLPVQRRDEAGYVPGSFSGPRAASIAVAIGLLGGLVGQGGSFVLIPLVLAVLKVPTRIAMATNLPIVAAAALAGFAGKSLTGQVPPLPALALIAGVAPGVIAGVRLGRRVSGRNLRWILAGVILAACLRMSLDLVR